MPTNPRPESERSTHEDEPLPIASEDEVLEETARMAREGLKALEADPREPKREQ